MFIGVYIDSEYFSDLSYCVKPTIDEITDVLTTNTDLDIEKKIINKGSKKLRLDLSGDKDYFITEEIFEIPDDTKYVIVSWNAYEGVGFNLKPVESLDKAKKIMKNSVDAYCDKYEYDVVDEYDTQVIIDTGTEWRIWQVIEINN